MDIQPNKQLRGLRIQHSQQLVDNKPNKQLRDPRVQHRQQLVDNKPCKHLLDPRVQHSQQLVDNKPNKQLRGPRVQHSQQLVDNKPNIQLRGPRVQHSQQLVDNKPSRHLLDLMKIGEVVFLKLDNFQPPWRQALVISGSPKSNRLVLVVRRIVSELNEQGKPWTYFDCQGCRFILVEGKREQVRAACD